MATVPDANRHEHVTQILCTCRMIVIYILTLVRIDTRPFSFTVHEMIIYKYLGHYALLLITLTMYLVDHECRVNVEEHQQ